MAPKPLASHDRAGSYLLMALFVVDPQILMALEALGLLRRVLCLRIKHLWPNETVVAP